MSNKSAGDRPDSRCLTLPFSRTIVLALILEGGLLVVAGSLFAQSDLAKKPDAPQVLELAFDEPKKEETKKAEVKKETPKPMPKPVPRKIVPPALTPRPPIEPPTPIKPLPVANQSPLSEKIVLPAPPPPPPPPPRDDAAAREASFAAQLRAAIQAAVVYPPAARMGGFHGQTRIEFVFKDGVCSRIHVIESSGSGLIDRAALAAVTAAAPPPIPDSLRGRSVTYWVTVLFELSPADS
jgi:protein TonB